MIPIHNSNPTPSSSSGLNSTHSQSQSNLLATPASPRSPFPIQPRFHFSPSLPHNQQQQQIQLHADTNTATVTAGSAAEFSLASSPSQPAALNSSIASTSSFTGPRFTFPISPVSDELTASQLVAAAFVSSPAAPLSPLSSRIFDHLDESGGSGLLSDELSISTPDHQSFHFNSNSSINSGNSSARHGRSNSMKFSAANAGPLVDQQNSLIPAHHRPSKSVVLGGGFQLQLPPAAERFKLNNAKLAAGDSAETKEAASSSSVVSSSSANLNNLLGSPARPRGGRHRSSHSHRLSMTLTAPIEEEELQSPSVFMRVQSMLEYGTVFNKYSMNGRGKPTKKRVFYRTPKLVNSNPANSVELHGPGILYWCDARSQLKEESKRSIPITEITDLYLGKQTTAFTGKFGIGADEDLCLSIVSKKRTLDLEAETVVEKQDFIEQLLSLLRKLCRSQVAIHHNNNKSSASQIPQSNNSQPPQPQHQNSLPLPAAHSVHPGVSVNRSLSFSSSQNNLISINNHATNNSIPIGTPPRQSASNSATASASGSSAAAVPAFKPQTPVAPVSHSQVQTPVKYSQPPISSVAANSLSGLSNLTPKQTARRLSLGNDNIAINNEETAASRSLTSNDSNSAFIPPTAHRLSTSSSGASSPSHNFNSQQRDKSPRNSISSSFGHGIGIVIPPSNATYCIDSQLSPASDTHSFQFGQIYSVQLNIRAFSLFPLNPSRLESFLTLALVDPIIGGVQLLDVSDRISVVHSPIYQKEFSIPHLAGLNPLYCVSIFDAAASNPNKFSVAEVSSLLPDSPAKSSTQAAAANLNQNNNIPDYQRLGSAFFTVDQLLSAGELNLSLSHSSNLFHQVRLRECGSRIQIKLSKPPTELIAPSHSSNSTNSNPTPIVSTDGEVFMIPPANEANSLIPPLHQIAQHGSWLSISPQLRSQFPFLRSVYRAMSDSAPLFRSLPGLDSTVSSAGSSVVNSSNNSPTNADRVRRLNNQLSAASAAAIFQAPAIPMLLRKRSSSTNISMGMLSNINTASQNHQNPLAQQIHSAHPVNPNSNSNSSSGSFNLAASMARRLSSQAGAKTLSAEQMRELSKNGAGTVTGNGSATVNPSSEASESDRNELIRSVENQIKAAAAGNKIRINSSSINGKLN